MNLFLSIALVLAVASAVIYFTDIPVDDDLDSIRQWEKSQQAMGKALKQVRS